MSIATKTRETAKPEREVVPPLEAGDHLDQPTFHHRYKHMPKNFRAELIGGVAFVPSPLARRHGRHHFWVINWLGSYEFETPGVEGLDGASVILGDDSEPQPDGMLILRPEYGGQTRLVRLDENKEEYVAGPPEFVVEVASSSQAYDLYEKKRDYERLGVQEYAVVLLRDRDARWFVRSGDQFVDLDKPTDGVYKSQVFPGLWLDVPALLAEESRKMVETLRLGLASPEHAKFVTDLRQRHPTK
ncbi:MAG: Uma2 family endonuclease [Pirellulales bacterium]